MPNELQPPKLPSRPKVGMGRFKISLHFIRTHSLLIALQEGMAVIDVNYDYLHEIILFSAIGPMFEPIEEGEMAPEYTVNVDNDPLSFSKPTITFTRIRTTH